ncbi:MAG: hypothetical protein ACYTGZ_21995 [Planctomycetota bacterium]|jgi:hypothetical protein
MAYLNVPRIHFAGKFFTDPSTMDNDPEHYKPTCKRPSPWQTPDGKHHVQFVGCTVRSAIAADGSDAGDDFIIGADVNTTDEPAPAKIFDVDVYQQGVSEIAGLQIQIPLDDTTNLTGTLHPPPALNSVYFKRMLPTRGWADPDYGAGGYGGDSNATGIFQTLLKVDASDWPSGKSKILDELRNASDQVDGKVLLSIRFTLDGYVNVYFNSDNKHGRITAAIGPGKANEPIQAAGPRWLAARTFDEKAEWYVPHFYGAPFLVDETRSKLVIDLANALCQEKFRGPPVDLGDLTAVIGTSGAPTVIGSVPQMQYSQMGYENNASICELDLTADQLKLLASNPLKLVTSRTDIGPPEVLAEDPSGLWWSADQRVWRLTPEKGGPKNTGEASVYVTRFGAPAPDVQLKLDVVSVHGGTPGATVPPSNPGNTPQADGALTASITPSNAAGVATVSMQVVKDPGKRTEWLDGQLYFLWLYQGDKAPASPPQENTISVLAWSEYPVKSEQTVTWEDVRSLMAPYARIFPVMTDLLDLTDQHSFGVFALNPPWWVQYGEPKEYNVDGINAGAIPYFLTREFDDPRFMPILRDLSPNKIQTVLNYCKTIKNTDEMKQEFDARTAQIKRGASGGEEVRP